MAAASKRSMKPESRSPADAGRDGAGKEPDPPPPPHPALARSLAKAYGVGMLDDEVRSATGDATSHRELEQNEATSMASPNPFERPAPAVNDGQLTAPQDAPVPVRHEDVVTRVRELLGKYPTLNSKQLFDLAIRMHPDLEATGFRSFHARYVLPLKREQARAEGRVPKRRTEKPTAQRPRKSRTSRAAAAGSAAATGRSHVLQVRARVRDILLRLARQVAIAESRADLVDALAGVEDLVDEVLRAMNHDQAGVQESVQAG
jgi:hypothetical protein